MRSTWTFPSDVNKDRLVHVYWLEASQEPRFYYSAYYDLFVRLRNRAIFIFGCCVNFQQKTNSQKDLYILLWYLMLVFVPYTYRLSACYSVFILIERVKWRKYILMQANFYSIHIYDKEYFSRAMKIEMTRTQHVMHFCVCVCVCVSLFHLFLCTDSPERQIIQRLNLFYPSSSQLETWIW